MHAKKTNKTKLAVVLLALALLVGCAAGATLAWLIDTTEPIVNTFTVGDINITLTETDAIQGTNKLEKSFKMIPGDTITKDPKVTVKGGSEACYLFVKIEEGNGFSDFLSYGIADGWNNMNNGVFYREVAASDDNQEFGVLLNNEVKVSSEATKAYMNSLTAETYPTLTFTAYAVQKANIDSAADAWSVATTGKLPTTP